MGALVESHMGMVFCVASDATRIVSYVLLGLFLSEGAEWPVQHFSRRDNGCSRL